MEAPFLPGSVATPKIGVGAGVFRIRRMQSGACRRRGKIRAQRTLL
ncbi:MAG: hypothetical protein K9K88_18195 [Desulfobacterales bacterium]|nr:hypothetical protein [Desulfobacterales bacterium]